MKANDYITWINSIINSVLSQYAKTYPTADFESVPAMTLLCSGINSDLFSTNNTKNTYSFTIEIAYQIEKGYDLASNESTLIDNLESVFAEIRKVANRTTGVVSGDIVKKVDMKIGFDNMAGMVVRYGRILIDIEAII